MKTKKYFVKIFLTGMPGCGKSTVLMKVIELSKRSGLKVGGIITPEIREAKVRVGFAVKDVYSGKEGILASIKQKAGPKLGKYHINLEDFERIAIEALDFALKKCDIICVDEIGKMELFSQKFRKAVYDVLKSSKPVVACLHREFVKEFEKFGKIITVNQANRTELPQKISNLLLKRK